MSPFKLSVGLHATDARSIIIMIIQSIALIKSADGSLMLYLVHAPLLIC